MSHRRRKRRRRITPAGFFFLALTGVGYAATAANLIPKSDVGNGAQPISGHTLTDVRFVLSSDPTRVDAVTFRLAAIPQTGSTITIRLRNTGSWFSCTNDGRDVTCDTTGLGQPTVAVADDLRVVIAQ